MPYNMLACARTCIGQGGMYNGFENPIHFFSVLVFKMIFHTSLVWFYNMIIRNQSREDHTVVILFQC